MVWSTETYPRVPCRYCGKAHFPDDSYEYGFTRAWTGGALVYALTNLTPNTKIKLQGFSTTAVCFTGAFILALITQVQCKAGRDNVGSNQNCDHDSETCVMTLSRADELLRDRTILMVLGAMKGGTMSLWRSLKQHPEICTTHKEQHYYDTHFNKRTREDYLCHMNGCCPGDKDDKVGPQWGQICAKNCSVLLDATPSYLYNALVPARVAQEFSGRRVKFVVLLREPVERCISHWFFVSMNRCFPAAGARHVLQEILDIAQCMPFIQTTSSQPRGINTTNYSNCIDFDANLQDQLGFMRVVYKSLYAPQLQQWFAHFPSTHRDRHFLVLKSEDLFTSQEAVLDQITSFVGVASFKDLGLPYPREHGHAKNARLAAECDLSGMRSLLQQFFHEHPYGVSFQEELNRILGENIQWTT